MRVTRAKRALVGTVTGAMVLGLLPAGAAFADTLDFDDVCEGASTADFDDKGSTHAAAIDCMNSYESSDGTPIIAGFGDGTVGTQLPTERQAFATLVWRFMQVADASIVDDVDADASQPFTDVRSTTHSPAISALYQLDIIDGTSATTFDPNGNLTRGQAAKVVALAFDALGFDFDAEYPDSGFSDVGNTFRDFIDALTAEGVIEGRTDGTYGYSVSIQRGQIATVLARGAQALKDAGIWTATLVEPPVADLTILDLSTTTPVAEGQGTLLLSDGSAVLDFVYDTTRDDFFVDGEAATLNGFIAAYSIGDQIEVSGDADSGFEHNLVSTDVTAGIVGDVDLGDNSFVITDFPSGIAISEVFDYDDLLFTVDNTTANQIRFERNLSVGDIIDVEVDEDGDAVRFNLTNNAPSGDVVFADTDNDLLVVDVLGDEDFPVDYPREDGDVEAIAGHIFGALAAGDDLEITVNGDDADISFNAAIDVLSDLLDDVDAGEIEGLAVTYGRAAGVVSIDVTFTEVAEAEFEAFSGIVLNLDNGDLIVAAGADDVFAVQNAGDATYRVNGLVGNKADYDAALSIGDTFACAAGDLAEEDPDVNEPTCSDVRLTDGTFAGQVTAASAKTFEVTLANGYVVADVVELGALGVDVDALGFSINGNSSYTRSNNDVEINVGVEFFLAALAATNLDVSTVNVSLDEDGADDFYGEGNDVTAFWNASGVPQSAINAGYDAQVAANEPV